MTLPNYDKGRKPPAFRMTIDDELEVVGWIIRIAIASYCVLLVWSWFR